MLYIEVSTEWKKKEKLNTFGLMRKTEVGKVDNGFVISIRKCGPLDEDHSEMVDEVSVTISKENPLKESDRKSEDDTDMSDLKEHMTNFGL